MLCVHVSELTEDEVGRAGEEEAFRRELVLFCERNSHCDVVVAVDPTHTTPELKLFKFSITAFVQQLLQAKVESQSKER